MEAIDQGRQPSSRARHRLNIEQFHRMIAADVFDDEDRIELIEGEMLDMPPIEPPHGGATAELNMTFAARLAGKAIVTSAGPLTLDVRNEVYPDLAVLKARDDFYRRRNPGPGDVHLLIEVSDSSLRRDLQTKLPIYARNGVPQVWIIDIQGRRIHVFQDPDPSVSTYRHREILAEGTLAVEIAGVAIALDITSLLRD